MNLDLNIVNKEWTLFLDRDGVINHEKHEDYIHTWDEFKFYDGVTEAIKIFKETFNRILVVTNQRGIGRGLTKDEDLQIIHSNMLQEIVVKGGHLDAIYYCGDVEDDSPYRKPNPGMGHAAVREFPDIDLSRSIMVGNTLSDMQFGRNLGMYTVFLTTTRPEVDLKDERIDMVFGSLIEFAAALYADKL
jgi:histidinol-phosphate phosphatase family protein